MDKKRSTPGVHDIKAKVDRLWFRQQKDRIGVTQKQLGEALAHELGLKLFDEAQISRRLSGRNRWTAAETQALAKIFGVPLEEVMRAVGGAAENPTTGTIDDTGRVIFQATSREPTQSVTFKTTNALQGATLTVRICPRKTTTSATGVYVVQVGKDEIFCLKQVMARVGQEWVLANVFGEAKIEHARELIFIAKALHLQFQ